MNRKNIFWGILMLVVAVALILNIVGVDLGLPEGLSAWRLLLGGLCAAWAVSSLISGKWTNVFLPLILNVWVFEGEIAEALGQVDGDLAPWWVFLLLAILLTAGCRLLFGHWKSKWEWSWTGKHHGKTSSVQYIDCSQAFHEKIDNSFSSYNVFFANKELFVSGSTIHIDNNFGSVVLHVPGDWIVTNDIDNSFGSVKIDAGRAPEDGTAKVLRLLGDNDFGSVAVERE